MAKDAPVVLLDREALNQVELDVLRAILEAAADIVDALAAKGGVYGQLVLPPAEAERKRILMEQTNG